MENPNLIATRKWLIRGWLARKLLRVDWIDHQDGMWCISAAFSTAELIVLWNTPNAVPQRRDQILFAIGLHVVNLLTPWETCTDEEERGQELAMEFCRANWNDILRIDREFGLGDEFETYVVPAMSDCT